MQQNYYKNKKSLALLGHSKLKAILPFTLLLIGLLVGMNGAFAQTPTPVPEAVKLDKKFIPDDETGHSGKIILETYVTGKVTQTTIAQPTDIVLVLDYSASMTWSYGNSTQTRRQALEQSVQGFISAIQEDAETNGCDHRIAVVKFSSQAATSILSISGHPTWGNNNTPSFSATNYQNALVTVNVNNAVNPLLTNQSLFYNTNGQAISTETQTKMDAGMTIANNIMHARTQTTFVVPNQTPTMELPRNMVVVFFTDGYPTTSHGGNEGDMQPYWREDWDMDDIADATCQQAANIKNISVSSGGSTVYPTIFSIGIHGDCDPTMNYQTTYSVVTTTGRPPQNVYGWSTGVQCLNGLLHFISSDYDGTINSWSGHIQTTDFRNNEHYLAPQNANDLIEAFGKITSAAGSTPTNMGSTTLIQDIIAPTFTLPEGTNASDIIVYAPKVTNVTGTEGNYVLTFADTTTVRNQNNQVQFLTLNNNGIVQDDPTKENRINPVGLINVNGKTITFSGFDFSGQFCGPKTEEGVIVGCQGRKLVIVFPIVIEEGVWGDDLNTNDELSFVTPDGTIQYLFPMPQANVVADVWTEIVKYQPSTFNPNLNPIPLYTPEDLAWFISWVNGRANYGDNNAIVPHPNANAILMADLDMSAHNWVSIGDETGGYTGTFNGNGHVITGLKNNASKYYKLDDHALVYPGMFSNVKGIVKNVFVLDTDFHAKNHILQPTDEFKTFIHFGIIADTLSSGGQIFNCEAAGRITCNTNTNNLERDTQMIFGGLVGFNDGGTIHSSMAMAELTGYTMGGAVGLNGGSFSNSFTNGVYNYMDNGVTGKYVGGIAAQNNGTINNCYVRFERANSNLTKLGNGFGMLVGSGTAPTNSYIPQIWTFSRPTTTSVTSETNINSTVPTTAIHPGENPTNSYTLSVTPTFYNMFVNDNMTCGAWGTLEVENNNGTTTTYNVYENGTSLLDTLNSRKGSGASWKRTTAGAYSTGAGDINDDLPVLQFDDYTCIGSVDGIRIDYAASLNEMLHRHNNGNMNENTNLAAKYKKTNHEAIYKGTINLYANDDVTLEQAQPGGKDGETVADNSTAEGVVVYIDENISLLQDASSSIEAYTGQTLQAYDNTGIQEGERWHNVSSSLSNSQFGWTYAPGQVLHNYSSNPCGWNLPNTDEDHAFFPIDIFSYHRAEFYCFYEPAYHWINFRRNGQSHWHMDYDGEDVPENHAHIDYVNELGVHDNETQFIPGKGYLTCVDVSTWWEFELNETTYNKNAQFLQNRGTLNNGQVTIPVTYTAANEWTGLAGYNLLGNPYQSYLDFATFASVNSALWNGDANAMTYAVYDPTRGMYVQATAAGQASTGAYAATGDINMHQGFFICLKNKNGGTATFNNTMRSNTPVAGTHFRGGRVNYPLINLIATDSEGNTDVAVLEVGRPENGGGEKLRVGSATGRISLRHDDTDFGILFSDMTEGSQPLRFETEEDGTFTLSWNTANANFSSLTLVDNITGVKYDMLTHNSYEFEGRASDYKSRFKILIGEFTDVEENEDPSTSSGNFAFYDGSDWVVNGKGQLNVVDMMGRTVYTGNLTNDQNRVSLNGLSQGVYLMQVHSAEGTMVQKIVVR